MPSGGLRTSSETKESTSSATLTPTNIRRTRRYGNGRKTLDNAFVRYCREIVYREIKHRITKMPSFETA